MADNKLPTPYLKRNFVYYDIDWAIDDFCLRFHDEKTEVWSPEFEGWERSKFKLAIISVPCKDSDGCSLWLSLKRLDSDEGPNKVLMDWKLTLSGVHYTQKVTIRSDERDIFERGYEKKVYIANKEDLINSVLKDMLNLDNPPADILVAECKTLIYEEDGAVATEFECSDGEIKLLSETLFQICESGVGSDVDLISGNCSIPCHKDILCARSKTFNRLIFDPEATDNDDIRNFDVGDDYEAMMNVIRYIYTGNLKHIFEKPSLRIFKAMELWGLDEVTEKYSPDSLSFYSLSEIQGISFTWTIEDCVEKHRSNESLRAVIPEVSSARSWQLSLRPLCENGQKFFSFSMKCDKKLEARSAFLQFQVQSDSIQYFCNKNELLGPRDYSEQFGFSEAFRLIHDLPSTTNTVTIVVKLKLYTGTEAISYFEKHASESVTSEEQNYSKLSADFHRMLRDGHFYSYSEENKDLKTHEFLVKERCNSFYDVLRNSEKLVEPRIRDLILSYIYSGVMPYLQSSDLLKVYNAAKTLQFTSLRKFCSNLLKDRVKGAIENKYSDMNRELIYKIFNAASIIEDESLKSECEKYFSRSLCSTEIH